MIDSNHSYERLNWKTELYRPIIRDSAITSCLEIDEITDNRDCDNQKSSSMTSKCQGEVASWSTSPVKLDNGDYQTYYLKRMLMFYVLHKDKSLKFLTLTVPPAKQIMVHGKKRPYGMLKFNEQLRYLKNNIYRYINVIKTKNYIIVFETTKKGICHLHMLYEDNNEDHEITDNYKDLAGIMGYTSYKEFSTNIVETNAINEGIVYYLCKIMPPSY